MIHFYQNRFIYFSIYLLVRQNMNKVHLKQQINFIESQNFTNFYVVLFAQSNAKTKKQELIHHFIDMLAKLIFLATFILASQATLFSVSCNFTVTYQTHYDELAHAYYNQKLFQDGTNYIYIYANGEKSLLEQHRGTGFIEGYMTYKEIYAAYNNFNSLRINSGAVTPKLQDYIDNQIEFIEAMAAEFERDLYWQHVYAYLEQCRYAYRGYLQKIHEDSRLDMYIGWSQFYYLTSLGDFRELLPAFTTKEPDTKDKSSVFVKNIDNELYVSHSTINSYVYMLRVMKSYNFPTRNANIGSQTITFSSRPAELSSRDDFYILSSGLRVVETSLYNFNKDNFKQLNAKTVPGWIRAMVASNLARNGKQWVEYFRKYHSGTHNNQWVVVDQQQLASNKNAVVFVEEAFSLIQITDMTDVLLQKGYVASYNVPINELIYKKLGTEKYPYDYDNDPRAIVFRAYNPRMNSVEDMQKWLLTNEEKDVRQGIAPREDQYTQKPAPYGIIDCKIISPRTTTGNYFWMVSGPSTSDGRFPVFDWSQFKDVKHQGMSQVFDFSWQKVTVDWEKNLAPSRHITIHDE